MKFSFLRLTVKGVLYLFLLAMCFWGGALNVWLGAFLGSIFGLLLFFDLQDFRFRRFFNLLFLNNEDWDGEFDLDKDLALFKKIHKLNMDVLKDIKNDGLLGLDINSPMDKKDRFIDLFNKLDRNFQPMNDLYGKYSLVAGFENQDARKAFFISMASFIDIYLIGRILGDCSSFGASLLDSKFSSIRSLVRSMIFPSTQIYIRSGFYILKRLKIKDSIFNQYKNKYVKDILDVDEIGGLPLWASVKYYASLWHLFKRKGVLPMQKNISLLASETKLRKGRTAMSSYEVNKVMKVARPGDIVLTRQAAYLTGMLIPGYWTHASLYMGDKDQLQSSFGNAGLKILKKYKLGSEDKILLEAIGEGVSASLAKKAMLADSIIVLRPNVADDNKLKAIEFILENLNKEYNFTFDFSDEESFICSELVYKAYSDRSNGQQNLGFGVKNILGNWTFTPQDMFDSFVGGNNKLEMVACYLHDKKFKKVVAGEFKDLKKLKW